MFNNSIMATPCCCKCSLVGVGEGVSVGVLDLISCGRGCIVGSCDCVAVVACGCDYGCGCAATLHKLWLWVRVQAWV